MDTPVTSAAVRQEIVQALSLDLIGPDPTSPHFDRYKDEILPQAPSKWYLGAPLELRTATRGYGNQL